jgi:hypothetical protein
MQCENFTPVICRACQDEARKFPGHNIAVDGSDVWGQVYIRVAAALAKDPVRHTSGFVYSCARREARKALLQLLQLSPQSAKPRSDGKASSMLAKTRNCKIVSLSPDYDPIDERPEPLDQLIRSEELEIAVKVTKRGRNHRLKADDSV